MNNFLFQQFKLQNLVLRNRNVMFAAADNLDNQAEARLAIGYKFRE